MLSNVPVTTSAEAVTRKITGAISMFAIFCVLMGAITICIDVGLRWITSQSIYALNEVLSFVFGLAVIATIPAGAAYRVNLRLDLFAGITSARLNKWLGFVASCTLLVFFLAVGVTAWQIAGKKMDQQAVTSLLYLPLHPVNYAASVSMFVAALVQLVNVHADVKDALSCKEVGRNHPLVYALVTALAAAVLFIGYLAIFAPGALTNFVLMNPGQTVLIGFGLLWLGVFSQLPLLSVTAALGVFGAMPIIGLQPVNNIMTNQSIEFVLDPQVATLPLFLIMGAFAVVAGISSDLFQLGNAILGRFKGGLAYATIAACAGFGAVSGNSIVTSATFGRMALPEMKRLGYAPALSTGTVAAGGTLGALVPPSGVIILFALLSGESIGGLFIAAMIPAILALLLYFAAVAVVVSLNKDLAPASKAATVSEVMTCLWRAGPVVGMFAVVIGGLYGGVFTVTESAAVGAVCAFLLALARGKINRASILSVFAETTSTVAMIYGLIFGGLIFAFTVNLTGAPDAVAALISGIDAQPVVILFILIVIYLLLGSVMDSFAVMIITLPVVTPIILDLGYDMLFWGVLMLVVVEIGMITPPFGMNLFILKSIDRDVNLGTVMKGVLPFVMADLVKIGILVAFPALALWLPSTMG